MDKNVSVLQALVLINIDDLYLYARSQWVRIGKSQRSISSTSKQAIILSIDLDMTVSHHLHDLDCDFKNIYMA